MLDSRPRPGKQRIHNPSLPTPVERIVLAVSVVLLVGVSALAMARGLI